MKYIHLFLLLILSLDNKAQTQLPIPDTLVGPNFILNMHCDSVQFFPGKKTQTYAYNQYKYLGPTLILKKGFNVNISVSNQIGDTTTVHWHGIHLPAKWDGGPHTPIMPNGVWNPQFKTMDHAATYWYHPHMHMKTAIQAIKGAAGLIIVRDSSEASLALPRKYGIDDFPVVVQCQQYDNNNQAMPLGMQDSILLVNGVRANYNNSVYGNFPAQVVRLRLLNASGERVFNFGFSGNKQFYQIASDGGLLNSSIASTRIRLAPGERAEILIDLTGMNGQTLYLMSYASELAMGIQGGPTMPMPGGPPMNSPLNGVNFNILKINVISPTINAITSIPSTLINNIQYPINSSNITRTIRFTADSAMVMDGPFYFNDSTFNMDRIDYKIPLNNVEIWKLVNETMVAHPFHIHDVQFYLFDRNGSLPGPEERGRKDVVLIPSGDSVMFITKFEDFTDTIIPYMYHCHILMHEDAGMMGQFVVKPTVTGIKGINKTTSFISVSPNPAKDKIQINCKESNFSTVQIFDNSGKLIYSENFISEILNINTNKWLPGLYTVVVKTSSNFNIQKILIE